MTKIPSLFAFCFCSFAASFAYAQNIEPCNGEDCTPNAVRELWNANADGFITQNWKTAQTTEVFTSDNLAQLTNSYKGVIDQIKKLGENGKLFLLPSGDTQSLYASATAGLPILDKEISPYLINVVAYQSGLNISNVDFIDTNTNLSKGAESWTLTAPGSGLIEDDCTSSAAQYVATVAQNVKTAFPYLNSLKIGGVLLSTASNAQDLTKNLPEGQERTDFMYRTKTSGEKQFFFFTDAGTTWDDDTKNLKVAEIDPALACGSGAECIDVTFEEAFGAGVINPTDALKGPAAFDANYLTKEEKDDGYMYTVTVTDPSTWSNDIEQVGSIAIGLKKSGTGELTLRGENSFSGKTIVSQGTLSIKGFSSEKLASIGNIDVEEGAILKIGNGTVSALKNNGIVEISNGSSTSDIKNNGILTISGNVTTGQITNNSASTSNVFSGVLSGSVENNAFLTINGEIDGDVNNNATLNLQSATLKGVFANAGDTISSGSVKITGEVENSGRIGMNTSNTLKVINLFNNMGVLGISSNATLSLQHDDAATDPVETVGIFNNYGTLALDNNARINLLENPATGEEIEHPYLLNAGEIILSENTNVSLQSDVNFLINTGKLTGVSNSSSRIMGNGIFVNMGTINSNLYINNMYNDGGKIIITSVINSDPIPLKGGTFDLNAGSLSFDVSKILPFNEPTGGKYTLIETTGALNINESKFKIETFNSPYLNVTRDTSNPKKYQVDVSFNKIDSLSPSFDTEELKVGQVIDRYYFNDTENTIAGFYYLSEKDLREKINEMRERVQPFSSQDLPLANTMADNVYTRLFSLHNEKYISPNVSKGRAGGDLKTHNKVWGQLLAGLTYIKANKETSSKEMEGQIYGAMFGYDFSVTDNLLVGLTGGWAESRVKQGDSKTEVTDWRAGVYFDAAMGNFSVQGLALAGKQNFTTDKQIVIPGLTAHTKADFDGTSLEGGLNIGYRLFSRNQEGLSRRYYGDKGRQVAGNPYFSLRPYVSGYYSKTNQDAYKETGNPLFTMAVSDSSDTSFSVQPGVAMFFATRYSNITVDIGYRRILSGGNPETTAYFTGDSLQMPFKTLAAQDDKDFAVLGLGYSTQVLENLVFNVNLNTSASKESLSSLLSASFIYTW